MPVSPARSTRLTLRLDGLGETLAAMRELPLRVETKVMRKAMTAAGKPIRKAMRDLCPKDTGTLRKELAQKVKFYRQSRNTITLIGPRSRTITVAGRKMNAAKYAHLVEFGTRPHVIRRKVFGHFNTAAGLYLRNLHKWRSVVRHPGIRPSGFMRRAFVKSRLAALRAFKDKAWKEIVAETEKLRAQGRAKHAA